MLCDDNGQTQIRKIETIAFTSGFGNLIYFVSLSIIFYDGFAHACCVATKDVTWVRGQGLALVFGTGCFALEGIGLVLPVKRAMKDQNKFGFILNVAISIVASCYIVFGVLGYLFYGDNVRSVITDNLASGALSDAVRVSLSISLFFSYAIQLFPVSDMADSLWDKHVFYKKSADHYHALDGAPHHEEEHANANGAAAAAADDRRRCRCRTTRSSTETVWRRWSRQRSNIAAQLPPICKSQR